MSLDLSGKVIALLAEQSGEGKNGRWVKQDFVIETSEQFPKKVCFSSWGDKVADVKKLKTGDMVTISFNPESREFGGKWYTDLRAWKISKTSAQTSGNQADIPPLSENDIPMEQDDDLPF
jgi:hypothetical protein